MSITIDQAIKMGYCITSRKHRLASRIDRKDWREYMARKHAPWDVEGQGMTWANLKGMGDQYRRVYSNDTIVVPASWIGALPNSGSGPDYFKES